MSTLSIGPGRLLWTDSVSDRSSDADDVVGSEIVAIIHDVKEAGFGANEHVSPDVVADAGADIDEEVIRTRVAGIEVNATGGVLVCIKTGALPSDSAEQIKTGLLAQPRLINPVKREEQGPIRLTAWSAERTLASFPVDIKCCAKSSLEDNVPAEVQVCPALFRANGIATGTETAVRAGDQGAGRSG